MIQMLDLENGNFMNRTRGKKMDYNKIVQGILDIGEAMLQSGAENFRLEDSFYRMCRSYGFKRSDVFVIPSNIQVTVETPRRDHYTDPAYRVIRTEF